MCEKESRAYSDYSMRQFKENRYGGYDALKNFGGLILKIIHL